MMERANWSIERRLAALIVVLACASVHCVLPDPAPSREAASPETAIGGGDVSRPRVLHVDTSRCSGFDPAIDSWDSGNGIGDPPVVPEIHAGLARFTDDPDGPVALELASTHRAVGGGLTHEFTLRPDIRFSDGSQLTAAEFKWSWERALRLGEPGGAAAIHLGNILGAADILQSASEELTGVTIVDDRRLQIDLVEPDPDFLVHVAHPVSFVLKPANVELWEGTWTNGVDPGERDAGAVEVPAERLPVGAGPFRLIGFANTEELVRCPLARNESYHGAPAALDYVVIERFVPPEAQFDSAPRWYQNLLQSGQIDLNPVLVDLGNDQLDGLLGLEAGESVGGVTRVNSPVGLVVMAINPRRPPLDGREFRRALLDVADIRTEIYGGPIGRPGRLTPPGLRGGVGTIATPGPSTTFNDVSVILESASDRETFTIVYPPNSAGLLYYVYVSNMTERWWQDYGIDFRVLVRELGSDDVDADAVVRQINLQSPDPEELFRHLDFPFGADRDDLHWVRLKEIMDSARATADRARRRSLYGDAEEYLLEHALASALHWDVGWTAIGVQPYVRGLRGATFPQSLFHGVWLDETAPVREVPAGATASR